MDRPSSDGWSTKRIDGYDGAYDSDQTQYSELSDFAENLSSNVLFHLDYDTPQLILCPCNKDFNMYQ